MSDPNLIWALTEEYKMLMRNSPKYDTLPVNKPVNGDMGNLKLIVDAEELFAEIQPQLDSSDFYLLMLNGQQGSGKSTLARELTHYAHLAGYFPLYSSGFDITEAPTKFVQQAIGHDKLCVILDDLSYVLSATSAKAQSKIKSFFALIRHYLTQANEGKQVKVMVVVIAHFTTAVPPIFKNSNVWIFSKPTTLEYDNMVKVVGRGEKSREDMERMFTSVVKIQEKANSNKDLVLTIYGEKYKFRWGDKNDPGDGRLMLLLLNGKPLIYNAQNRFCDVCKHIGFGVKINMKDYETVRPSEEATKDASKRGTQ